MPDEPAGARSEFERSVGSTTIFASSTRSRALSSARRLNFEDSDQILRRALRQQPRGVRGRNGVRGEGSSQPCLDGTRQVCIGAPIAGEGRYRPARHGTAQQVALGLRNERHWPVERCRSACLCVFRVSGLRGTTTPKPNAGSYGCQTCDAPCNCQNSTHRSRNSERDNEQDCLMWR
jgi:hypothetical protein